MTRFPVRLTLALACGLAAACGPSEDDGAPAGTPLDGAKLAVIEVEWHGENDPRRPVLLDSSTAILLGDGAALVSDPMNTAIHRIEIAVRPTEVRDLGVQRFGGRGDGPGEFHSVGGLALIADTLFVSDPVRGGVHLLSLPDLEFQTLRVWEAEARTEGVLHFVVSPPAGIWPLAGGNAIARPNSMAISASPRRAGLVRGEQGVPFPLLRPGESSWTAPAESRGR